MHIASSTVIILLVFLLRLGLSSAFALLLHMHVFNWGVHAAIPVRHSRRAWQEGVPTGTQAESLPTLESLAEGPPLGCFSEATENFGLLHLQIRSLDPSLAPSCLALAVSSSAKHMHLHCVDALTRTAPAALPDSRRILSLLSNQVCDVDG